MTKEKFILYISKNNPGYYKTRQAHIKKIAPNILDEIQDFISNNKLEPLNFNDRLKYYINNKKSQNKCVCGKKINFDASFCSNSCRKDNIDKVLKKTRNTLKEKYGKDSPLKIKQFKEKFQKTSKEKYGENHPSKNDDVKYKIKKSNKDTYEDINVRKKLGNSISRAYKENKEKIIEKRRKTNFIKYGEYTTLTTYSISNAKNTLNKKYNVTNPFEIHEDTYEKAKLGSINFYKNKENKEKSIEKRIKTITEKYGSLESMNKIIFQKKKSKILNDLRNIGFKDEILEYNYKKLGFITCKCNKKHEYEISFQLLRDRLRRNDIVCTKCSLPLNKYISNGETEIYNWLSQYISCERNNRKILGGQEIDIFIPEKNIAIEFNGIYWHSDLFKDNNYHLNKTLLLKNKGIKLIHIWEDQWNNKKHIIKSRILSQLNLNKRKIGARQCTSKNILSKEANNFFEENHLQGKTKASIYLGLYYDEELVSAIAIGKRKIGKNKEDNFEILRFCNKLNIKCIGSFSKLFKYIKDNYSGNFISYADLGWGEGNVYKYAGFNLIKYSKPNYWYFIENIRYHRYSFTKRRLIKLGYDKNKTEKEIMDENIKALRIYDSGNAVWKFNNIFE